jgi:putative photosynthetic complex assembly protein
MIVREYEEDEVTVHRAPLMLMGGLVIISLLLTISVTTGLLPKSAVASEARAAAGAQVANQRSLRFFDEANGIVRVEDGASGEVLGRFGPGEGGFIRASVRSLVHQRRIRGLGAEVAFELIEWDNDSYTLLDPATERTVEVGNFGPDNRAIFVNILRGLPEHRP